MAHGAQAWLPRCLLSALLATLRAPRGSAQEVDPCGDIIPAEGTHAYKLRGDRCEGRFKMEVTAAPELLSLTVGRIAVPGEAGVMTVAWEGTPLRPVRLSARVLRSNTYYRMDPLTTLRAPFRWPVQGLVDAGFPHAQLAFRGVVERHSEEGSGWLLAPVRDATAPDAGHVDDYLAVFVCGAEIAAIDIVLRDHTANAVHESGVSKRGRYPQNYPIRVSLPRSQRGPGRFEVSVVMTAKGELDPPTAMHFGFLHD